MFASVVPAESSRHCTGCTESCSFVPGCFHSPAESGSAGCARNKSGRKRTGVDPIWRERQLVGEQLTSREFDGPSGYFGREYTGDGHAKTSVFPVRRPRQNGGCG